jgi:hypothetical protein
MHIISRAAVLAEIPIPNATSRYNCFIFVEEGFALPKIILEKWSACEKFEFGD